MWPFSKKKELPKGSISYSTGTKEASLSGSAQKGIMAILILVIIIVLVIVYLSSSIFPKQQKEDSAGSQKTAPATAQLDKKTEDISIKSEVSGYTVELSNKKELLSLLSSWSIYNRNYEYPNEGSTKKKPLKLVFLHLVTDSRYISKTYIDESKEILQTGLTISPGIFDVFLYVNPEIITKDIKRSNQIVNMELLSRFYFLAFSNNETLINSKNKAELGSIFKKYGQSPFLTIKSVR